MSSPNYVDHPSGQGWIGTCEEFIDVFNAIIRAFNEDKKIVYVGHYHRPVGGVSHLVLALDKKYAEVFKL